MFAARNVSNRLWPLLPAFLLTLALILFYGFHYLYANLFFIVFLVIICFSSVFLLHFLLELPSLKGLTSLIFYGNLTFAIYRIFYGQPNLFELYFLKSIYELPTIFSGVVSYAGFVFITCGLSLYFFEEPLKEYRFPAKRYTVFIFILNLFYLNSMIIILQKVFIRGL